jgi:hypothetical protein
MKNDHVFIWEHYGGVHARCGLSTASFPVSHHGSRYAAVVAAKRWAYDLGAVTAEIRLGDSVITERLRGTR